MTDTPEVTPVRSSSPELSAMTLPKLKEVATQLGIDGAAKLKKDALVTAIADLQAANREAAKAEREARREARNAKKRGNKDNAMIVVAIVVVTAIAIAKVVTAATAKSARS